MNCQDFQHYIAEHVDAALSPDAQRHLGGCARCRELNALIRGDLDVFPMAPPADLAASILERTSGSACDRARELLCPYVDQALDALDTGLVQQHTEGCTDCRQIELALRSLAEDLPAMALLSPGPAFVDGVLEITARPQGQPLTQPISQPRGWDQRIAARVQDWGRSAAAAWQRMLERPRFGLEASYVGALAMWALFGISASPFSHVPAQALSALQTAPVNGVQRASSAVDQLQAQLGDAGKRTWEASTEQGAETIDLLASGVQKRLDRTAESRRSLRHHGGQLGDAAMRLDLEQTAQAARGLGEGLGKFWNEMHSIRPLSNTPDYKNNNGQQPSVTTDSEDC